jgi:hypothetical protein
MNNDRGHGRESEGVVSSAGRSRFRRLAWIPVLFLLVLMAVLWALDPRGACEPRHLMLAFNILFSGVAAVLVAVLVGRSFLDRSVPGLLPFGCGVLIWGSAGLLVGAFVGRGINVAVTMHNSLVWTAAAGYLAGALVTHRPHAPLRRRLWWLAGGYAAAIAVIVLVASAALHGWLPPFFVQGTGGTRLRYCVLGSAAAMYAATAAILLARDRRSPAAFLHWYGLAMALIASGLVGIMIERVHAGALSWTARAAQFMGGAYMLVAAIASRRESGEWRIALDTDRWGDRLVRVLTPERLLSLSPDWRYGLALAIAAARTRRGELLRSAVHACRRLHERLHHEMAERDRPALRHSTFDQPGRRFRAHRHQRRHANLQYLHRRRRGSRPSLLPAAGGVGSRPLAGGETGGARRRRAGRATLWTPSRAPARSPGVSGSRWR